MLAVFAVVLALAGAPASTPIACVPTLPDAAGVTYFDANGPVRIEVVDDLGCAAARFAAADRQGRIRFAVTHQPYFGGSFAELLGVGFLVLLHEAEHVGLRSGDECQVETAAMAKLPILLRQFAPRLAAAAMTYATRYNAFLPASYRGC